MTGLWRAQNPDRQELFRPQWIIRVSAFGHRKYMMIINTMYLMIMVRLECRKWIASVVIYDQMFE